MALAMMVGTTALAMTAAGARGQTRAQMEALLMEGISAADLGALHRAIAPSRQAKFSLRTANALWAQRGFPFLPAFIDQTRRTYEAQLDLLDFADEQHARETINKWVEEKTRDRIKNLIPHGILNADTRLVLTNAIYFKARWANTFSKNMTQDGDFTLADGKTTKAKMMRQTERMGYGQTPDAQIVRIPYEAHEAEMLLIVPRKADALAAVEEKLADFLAPLHDARRVELHLPRFTMTHELNLARTLKAMGMTDAFDPFKADFSGMSTADRLAITDALHKAFVLVDEEGTEAAAATAIMVGVTAMPIEDEPVVVKADRPFLFLIRHTQTGAILFMGRVTNLVE